MTDALFAETSDGPRLLGSCCKECGNHTFPRQEGCPRCSARAMADVELLPRGTLWTWTTQAFRPKSPPYAGTETEDNFEPYFVGYVELEGQLRVESRIIGVTLENVAIGMPLELTLIPFGGAQTFAFQPQPA